MVTWGPHWDEPLDRYVTMVTGKGTKDSTPSLQAFVALYSCGQTMGVYDTVGKCCDQIRAKDEGTSLTNKLWVDLRYFHGNYDNMAYYHGNCDTIRVITMATIIVATTSDSVWQFETKFEIITILNGVN